METLKEKYESKKNDLKEIKRIEGIIEQQRSWKVEHNYITAFSKQKQVDRLNGVVPYALVRGNHDKTLDFNKFLSTIDLTN